MAAQSRLNLKSAVVRDSVLRCPAFRNSDEWRVTRDEFGAIGQLFSSAFCLLPSAFCLLPSAFCLLPSAFCLLPSDLTRHLLILPRQFSAPHVQRFESGWSVCS